MNMEFFIVVQAAVTHWALPFLPSCQFPLSPGRKKLCFPGLWVMTRNSFRISAHSKADWGSVVARSELAAIFLG